ncbi:MAG: hypothetical protein HQ513_09925, partial [Rhodospirillales bacterium]|nr:hypothetical protein [Rhodospirillales bacterium]
MNRKITYFYAGVVADFIIPEDRFDDFSLAIGLDKSHSEDEIQKAQGVLGAFVAGATEEAAGPEQILAACYIWNYFNTHPVDDKHIEGDVVIIDLEGNGVHIDYAAASDI